MIYPNSCSSIQDGDINNYPFDTYNASYLIFAYSSPSNSSFGDPLPITAFIQGTVPGFTVNADFLGSATDGSGLLINFTADRSAVSKLFAVIVFVGQYTISMKRWH